MREMLLPHLRPTEAENVPETPASLHTQQGDGQRRALALGDTAKASPFVTVLPWEWGAGYVSTFFSDVCCC